MRLAFIALAVLIGGTAPSAAQQVTPQQPVTDEWCTQAQLEGLWQVRMADLSWSCTIRIAAGGAVTSVGTCLDARPAASAPQGLRGGPLTIDKFCRVTGPLNLRICAGPPPQTCETRTVPVDAFSTADRTHLVGTARTPDGTYEFIDFIYRLK